MECNYSGNYKISHSKKRKLFGSEKIRALTTMLNENVNPSVFNRIEASRLMSEGDKAPAQIPSLISLRTAKSRAISLTRLHQDPVIAINIMKYNSSFCSTIRDIGYDGFFVHFWSNLQLRIYKDCYSKCKIPSISFDATGGCCRKIKRPDNTMSSNLFLYEGVMEVDGKTFTVCSMISEKHDTLSICTWLKRWLKCGVKSPKMAISDQSLALMSAIVQSFTQYNSLEEYLRICFKLIMNTQVNEKDIPLCFVRNDINHFVKLISQWTPLKKSKFPRTRQLFIRSMTLLIYCSSMEEAKQILEAIFKVALSKYDGLCLGATNNNITEETPCAKSKKYLQSLISNKSSYFQTFDNYIENTISNEESNSVNESICADIDSSFMNWASIIANRSKIDVEQLEGEYDNAQYVPEIVPLVLNAMKLYPCWSGIMTKTFKYGDASVSSCRVESNFNNIKNRVFNGDNLPMRVDNFLEKLVSYYNGDHLLLQSSDSIVTTNSNIDENLGSNLDTNNYNSQTVSSNKSIINEHHLNDQELETDCTDEGFYIGGTINNSNQKLYNKNVVQIEEDQDMECTEKRKTSTGTILNNEFNTNICLPCKNIDENLGSNLDTNNYNSQTVSSNKSIINEHHLNDQELEPDCTDEGFYIGGTINNSNQKLYNKNVVQIEEDQDMECTEKRKTSTGTILNNEFNTNICLPCKNGDFPTGIHRCAFCNRSVHLFGCSVNLVDSEEGYGESRICLLCFNQSEENNAEEQWQKKNISNRPPIRSANSYLTSQPGFDHLDLSQNGSIKAIIFLKNGNTFQNKPCTLPGIGKVILNNSCSPDSLMSILACAAADSKVYYDYLSSISKKDKTAKFIISMLNTKTRKVMHKERIILLAPYFLSKDKHLIGGISTIDAMDTLSSTAHKMLKNMPSYKKINQCTNFTCEDFSSEQSYEVVKLTAIDGKINIQKEVDIFFKNETTICSYCDSKRNITVNVKKNVLIELVSIPKELEASTSALDIDIINDIQQNYAGETLLTLDEIPKTLNVNGHTYYIRGTIVFNSGLRTGLRVTSGHYKAFAYRKNNYWEVYDDLKDGITQPKAIKNNVEVIIYTI
ncbi:unnamed protein product [Macrosiphum euphorbiae]|uniref:USP domain-containing protein n=2 Tax=Macrosiphum euphorbiae TaxID=13131 RepID=A0AAV0VK37_9HEMI|nr:unnamed protein product [Macrosiphum euphorbiae]